MKYLALIPARGGSKRIPKKNIKPLNGKPLILYTIDAAKEIFDNQNICVSTDSEEIKDVVENDGLTVSFLRPNYLATDKAGSHEVILHALEFYEAQGKKYDVVVLLQPTSPLRTSNHIKEAMALFSNEIDMVVSVKESNTNPYYNVFEENEEGLLKKSKEGYFVRIQDCPKVYEYNGAIYVISVAALKKAKLHQLTKIKKYVMSAKSSIDIDVPLDFQLAELLLNN